MDVPHFNHTLTEGHFDCFKFLAFTNKAAMNNHVQVCVDINSHFTWDKCPGMQLLDQMVIYTSF